MRAPPISAKAMAQLGWTRVDPRPWSKLAARWQHRAGWRLEHCGHPTALHPWMLYNPAGSVVLTGAGLIGKATHGTAWNDLRRAAAFVDSAGASFLRAVPENDVRFGNPATRSA